MPPGVFVSEKNTGVQQAKEAAQGFTGAKGKGVLWLPLQTEGEGEGSEGCPPPPEAFCVKKGSIHVFRGPIEGTELSPIHRAGARRTKILYFFGLSETLRPRGHFHWRGKIKKTGGVNDSGARIHIPTKLSNPQPITGHPCVLCTAGLGTGLHQTLAGR